MKTYNFDVFLLLAWTLLVVSVLMRSAWLAVIPIVYILAPYPK